MAPGRWQCPCFQAESEEVVVLEYSHCNLDDVPTEVFTFERTLEELYLDANQIKDLPRALFHCHGLRKLVLSDNEVQSVPPAIASLINLEELDISKNGVLEIPDNIKGCKCLSIIEASVNPLGRLPEGFTQLANLSELYLNDTFLEYLPANFGRLCHLRILELRENHLKVLPKSMARLTELTRLDIGQNDFSELPEVVGNLLKLVELWCDGNRILRIPPYLGHLKKLSYLDASKNRVQEVSAEMDGCMNLTDLTLSSNKIKHLPHTLGNLKKLLVLRVDNNHMATLPPSLGNLQLLEELVVSFNVLNSLPASLGLLRFLHTLIADDNCLEELPQEIGSCVNLSILSVRNNRLSLIPDELGHINKLRVINLVGNRLCHLPFSIAKLPYLHALWLAENQAKPLIPLQSDVDQASGQRVLTCFMLPQSPVDRDGEPTTPDSEAEREVRQQIKFASDIDSDRPGKLVRAPTPYPKELKAHARHARNFVLKKLEANGSLPLDKSMSSPEDEDDVDGDEEEKVVTPNQHTPVREAKVAKSPKETLSTVNSIIDINSTSKMECAGDVLPTDSSFCNGSISARGSLSGSCAPLAVIDSSSPSLSPSGGQGHPDNRSLYANTTRGPTEMDNMTHSTRPQSRCDVSPRGALSLPSVHGQLSPDSENPLLSSQGSLSQGLQRSPRGSLASSPHGPIPPGSLTKDGSIIINPSRVPNSVYPMCLSPQGHGGLGIGEACELPPYGSGSRMIPGLPLPSSSQQIPVGSTSNRMIACSGIAWYTDSPSVHHQSSNAIHHQHSAHHLRQAPPQVEALRPYSRASYSEVGYSSLLRGVESNCQSGMARRGSPVGTNMLHGTGGAASACPTASRWSTTTTPTDKRNSFPLARQSSTDLHVAPLHHHSHVPSSCHPPSYVPDSYRGGSRGSSRSSSPLTTFPHHHHQQQQQQQASYAVEVRGSPPPPPPLENPLPLPPKPRAMSNDGCRTLPARAQQHNMASLNRQCLRVGGDQYSYCHYPQSQWRGSPVSVNQGVAPDVNLNPWPHPHPEDEEDAMARHMSAPPPSHGILPQHWRYSQSSHQAHHNVFPVILDGCNATPDQLGFRFEGGVGTPRNVTYPDDQNFYVTQVLEKSPAGAALQPGDRILQVNGVDLCGLDHMQALDTIRSAGPSLSLLISRGR